jgi:crossover junction endodeoxyribonuclease RusA
VTGSAISHRSRNKVLLANWRQTVSLAAAQAWGDREPLEIPLKITASYHHEKKSIRIDTDNLVQPIQNALIGLIYQDDRWITDTVVRKTSINGLFYVRGASMVLLGAFSKGETFVHIVVDHAPDHAILLK